MRLTILLRLLALGAAAGLAACGGTAPTQTGAGSDATPLSTLTAPGTSPIRIGIALGGGAAKGFAHIGVIKMLEANGLAPAVVSGTSAGSVVGALYASGMNAFEMQEKAVALDEAKIRDLQLSSGGLVLGQKLEDYVNEQVRRKPLSRWPSPLWSSPRGWKTASARCLHAATPAKPCAHQAACQACSSPSPSASTTLWMAAS